MEGVWEAGLHLRVGGAGGLALQTWQPMDVMTTDKKQACLACLWEAE